MVTACPAPRTTFRWLPCHCWPPHLPATRALWPLSLPAPTRPTQPSCAHLRVLASVGRSGLRPRSKPSAALHGRPVCCQVWTVTEPLNGAHPLTQVVLIGDGVGGILGFDALCHSANAGTGSRGSSRRGSMVSVAKPSLLRRGVSLSVSRSLPLEYVFLHVGRSPAAPKFVFPLGLCPTHPHAALLTSKLSRNLMVSDLRMVLSSVPSRATRCSPQRLARPGTRWQTGPRH